MFSFLFLLTSLERSESSDIIKIFEDPYIKIFEDRYKFFEDLGEKKYTS